MIGRTKTLIFCGLIGVLVAGLTVAALAMPVRSASAAGELITGRVHTNLGVPLGGPGQVWAEPFAGGPAVGTGIDPGGFYTITLPGPGLYRVGARKLESATKFYSNTFDWNAATPVSVALGSTASGIDFFLDPGGGLTGTLQNLVGLPITNAWVVAQRVGTTWGMKSDLVDSHGVYTITGLPFGQYKLVAEAPGYERAYFDGQVDWAFAQVITIAAPALIGPFGFTLKDMPHGAIAGLVINPQTGLPVSGGYVEAQAAAGTMFRTVPVNPGPNPPTGTFTVAGLITGTWKLRAHPPVGPAYVGLTDSPVITVVLPSDSLISIPPLTLTTVNVAGKIVLPTGAAVAGAGVSVHKLDFSIQLGTASGPDGYFKVGGLPPGLYAVDVFPPANNPGLLSPPPLTFTIPPAFTFLNTITLTFPTKQIQVLVNDGNGLGVAGVDVNANRRGAPGWMHEKTGLDGWAHLNVGPGEWEVMINPAAGGAGWIYPGAPQMVTFDTTPAPEQRSLTFTVDLADAWVSGRVLAPDCVTPMLAPGVGVEIRQPDGTGNHGTLDVNGYFTVPVVSGDYAAWVFVDQALYPTLVGPQVPPFSVAPGATYALGNLCVLEKSGGITGQVTNDSGIAVAGVRVHAWKKDGGWASAETGMDGHYFLSVISGTWEVNVELPVTSTLILANPLPRTVTLTQTNQIRSGVDFVLLSTASTIAGTLVDANGQLLTGVAGWAYARKTGPNTPPLVSGPIQDGVFQLNVPHGSYQVGVWLPPNSGYTVQGGEQGVGPLAAGRGMDRATAADVAAADMQAREFSVEVNAGTAPVTFTLLANDATLVGGFFLDDNKTLPAVGLEGEVFAMAGIGGAWRVVPINPADGRYTMTVASGTWNLGYHLRTADFVNNPPPATRVTITSSQVFTFNFTAVAADATIEGVIQKPDTSPLNQAAAWAHRNRTPTSAAIDTGAPAQPPTASFRIRVPAGGSYDVGAWAPAELNYLQPQLQVVTPTTSFTPSVVLRFRSSNGDITGTVAYHGEAGNGVAGPGAWVWAWSEDGQHTGSLTDVSGQFHLNVVTGTVWHIGAAYHPEGTALFYRTLTPTVLALNTPTAQADLDIYLVPAPLPAALAATFDPSVGWTGVLSDGTRIEIPAGAMPTTDTVRISVTPLVEELPNTLSARPFGYGYAIAAYEETTGNQIVNTFYSNVLVTFYYTDADLQERGVTEADLSPAYFSTTTNSWTKVESFTVDTTANRVTAQISHFSKWSLTSPALGTGTPGYTLYLPLVLRQ